MGSQTKTRRAKTKRFVRIPGHRVERRRANSSGSTGSLPIEPLDFVKLKYFHNNRSITIAGTGRAYLQRLRQSAAKASCREIQSCLHRQDSMWRGSANDTLLAARYLRNTSRCHQAVEADADAFQLEPAPKGPAAARFRRAMTGDAPSLKPKPISRAGDLRMPMANSSLAIGIHPHDQAVLQ